MRQSETGFIKYIVIIAVILLVVFLSQGAFFAEKGQNLVSNAQSAASGYLSKGSNWVASKIVPKVEEEVENGGAVIKNEMEEQKEKISETVGEKIKNYFSGIGTSIVNPEAPQNCPPAGQPASQ